MQLQVDGTIIEYMYEKCFVVRIDGHVQGWGCRLERVDGQLLFTAKRRSCSILRCCIRIKGDSTPRYISAADQVGSVYVGPR